MQAVVLKPFMFTAFRALTLITSLQHHPFPLLLKTLSGRSALPLAPCNTLVVIVLLKQFSSELETKAKVILIKLIGGETGSCELQPAWVDKGPVMEIMHG
jgi:hypothetical protein